jgi:hypothetical protein
MLGKTCIMLILKSRVEVAEELVAVPKLLVEKLVL